MTSSTIRAPMSTQSAIRAAILSDNSGLYHLARRSVSSDVLRLPSRWGLDDWAMTAPYSRQIHEDPMHDDE